MTRAYAATHKHASLSMCAKNNASQGGMATLFVKKALPTRSVLRASGRNLSLFRYGMYVPAKAKSLGGGKAGWH